MKILEHFKWPYLCIQLNKRQNVLKRIFTIKINSENNSKPRLYTYSWLFPLFGKLLGKLSKLLPNVPIRIKNATKNVSGPFLVRAKFLIEKLFTDGKKILHHKVKPIFSESKSSDETYNTFGFQQDQFQRFKIIPIAYITHISCARIIIRISSF